VLGSDPTVRRRFARGDTVTAFAEVYVNSDVNADDVQVTGTLAIDDETVRAVPGTRVITEPDRTGMVPASTRTDGHIVAMGGGGFSMETENPLLDDFVLRLSRRQPARVCFLPTASADAATYVVRFYRAFGGRCVPTELTLWNVPALSRQPPRTSDLAAFIAEQDVAAAGNSHR
jgi:hypothetical protein